MQNESDFVRLRDNRRKGHSLRGKAYKSGLNGIKKVGREGCLTKTGSKAASSLTIPGQLTDVPVRKGMEKLNHGMNDKPGLSLRECRRQARRICAILVR